MITNLAFVDVVNQTKKATINKRFEEKVKSRRWYLQTKGKYEHIINVVPIKKADGTPSSKSISLASFILDIPPGTGEEVDHMDRNGWNNTVENFRVVDRKENCRNKGKYNTKNKYKYVYPTKYGKWAVRMTIFYKYTYLGTFDTEEEASMVAHIEYRNAYGKDYVD